MSVIKLNKSHASIIKNLFSHNTYMGIPVSKEYNDMLYYRFCDAYISNLNNFHSYGFEDNGEIKSLIGFYESDEEPAWYYTLYRSNGNSNTIRKVLDKVIEHNENNNRLKFYSLVPKKHLNIVRKFSLSKYNRERYDSFDECLIPAKHKSIYTNHWELLFKRSLINEDTVVRCSFLKQKYRKILPIGGNL